MVIPEVMNLAADPLMTDDTRPKVSRTDPMMIIVIRAGRIGTVPLTPSLVEMYRLTLSSRTRRPSP